VNLEIKIKIVKTRRSSSERMIKKKSRRSIKLSKRKPLTQEIG
jgi:hypothetical protein